MRRLCRKIQAQFKHKIRYFLSEARKKKMIFVPYFQMNVLSSMNRNMKLSNELQWLIPGVAISWLTSTANLITRPKISFTLLDQSIQMRLQKNAKFMMWQKINGQRFKTWPSLVTTTQLLSMMVGTSTSSGAEIAWMRPP